MISSGYAALKLFFPDQVKLQYPGIPADAIYGTRSTPTGHLYFSWLRDDEGKASAGHYELVIEQWSYPLRSHTSWITHTKTMKNMKSSTELIQKLSPTHCRRTVVQSLQTPAANPGYAPTVYFACVNRYIYIYINTYIYKYIYIYIHIRTNNQNPNGQSCLSMCSMFAKKGNGPDQEFFDHGETGLHSMPCDPKKVSPDSPEPSPQLQGTPIQESSTEAADSARSYPEVSSVGDGLQAGEADGIPKSVPLAC